MKISSLCFLCLGGFIFLGTNFTWPDQPQSQPSTEQSTPLAYSVEVELSQIAVRVVDRNGKPVSGLTKKDLELFEDGLAQEIRFMDEIIPEYRQQENPPQTAPFKRTDLTQAPVVPPNFIFIVFDTCNSGQTGIAKHKKYVKEFLTNFRARNTMFCIVLIKPSGDYEIAQSFTSNKNEVLAAVDGVHGSAGGIEEKSFKASRLADSRRLENCSPLSGFSKLECAEQALRDIVYKANDLASEEQVRSSNSIHSLQQLFTSAEHVPGQKSVILVSEGLDPAGAFYYNYGADVIEQFIQHFGLPPSMRSVISEVQVDANRSISKIQEIQQLTQSANASKLPVYWVNPEYGKKVEDISSELSSITSLTTKLVNAPDMEFAMRGFAEETGGAALSSTDMNSFYSHVAENIPQYYLISYKPPRPLNDGRVHRIIVKSKNKSCMVTYAKDFKDLELKDRITDQLAAAHDFPDLTRNFSFIHQVNYFTNTDGKYRVLIDTGMPYQEIEPQVSGENAMDDIHLSFLVRDDKGNVIFDTHPILQIRRKYSEFQALKENHAYLDFFQPLSLTAGDYTISVAIMDVAKWKTSVDSTIIRLPGRTDSCLSLSPAMLASRIRKSDSTSKTPVATPNGEILYGDNVLSFSVSRIFPLSGSLSGFYQIYNANLTDKQTLSVSISFKLYRDKTVFINQTPEHVITSFTDPFQKTISDYFSVPYTNLAPGSYELEINVRDASTDCSASTRVSFEIARKVAGSEE